jgi:hypothetical protein
MPKQHDLREITPPQVMILPELALGAGGRLVQACIGLAEPSWPIRFLFRRPERQRRPSLADNDTAGIGLT